MDSMANVMLVPNSHCYAGPFCNSNKSVHCTLDMEAKLGTVRCHLCPATYTHGISHLTEPIDLYHDWLDGCEEANK